MYIRREGLQKANVLHLQINFDRGSNFVSIYHLYAIASGVYSAQSDCWFIRCPDYVFTTLVNIFM